jgi:PAS domain S-box-containing protein
VALALSHYHYLIELSLDAIVLETANQISFSNPTAQRMIGLAPEALVGRRIDEFLEPVFLSAMHDEMRQPGADRMPFIARRLRRADGSALDVEVAAVPFTFEEGRAVQVVLRKSADSANRPEGVGFAESQFRLMADQMPLVLWDTDLDGHAVGEARNALGVDRQGHASSGIGGRLGVPFDVTQWLEVQDFRREAARTNAIGQLAGGVAHEINNVLAIISTNAQLLVGKAESAGSTAANVIVEATTRAAEITRNLLAFAMREVHLPIFLAVNDLIGRVTDALTMRAPASVTIELKLSQAPCYVSADETGLSRALTNLCMNAFDAMPDGGHLTIEVCEVQGRAAPGGESTSFVEVRVSDTGIGMDESTRARAFEPFFTAFPEARHVGLGLSMVQGVLGQHGGTVRLESLLDKGTTVTLSLPSVAAPVPALPAPPSIASGRLRDVSGRKKVLVVDDEPMLRRLSGRMLKTFGYECIEAQDGAVAVERFRESPGEFAFVLLDVVMPVMSGVEALPLLRGIDPDVRVVLCTGYFLDELTSDAFDSGALTYLGKPYLLKNLREAVDKVTGRVQIAV